MGAAATGPNGAAVMASLAAIRRQLDDTGKDEASALPLDKLRQVIDQARAAILDLRTRVSDLEGDRAAVAAILQNHTARLNALEQKP